MLSIQIKVHILIPCYSFFIIFKLVANYYLFFKFYRKLFPSLFHGIQINPISSTFKYLKKKKSRENILIYLRSSVTEKKIYLFLRSLCFGIHLKLHSSMLSCKRETKYSTLPKITKATSKIS